MNRITVTLRALFASTIALAALAPLSISAPQGSTVRLSVGPGGAEAHQSSQPPDCSSDGRFVVFATHAGNLVANDTNAVDDVFLADRQANTLVRISLAAGGAQISQPSNTPHIADDASLIAYSSWGDPVPGGIAGGPDLFAYRVATGTTVLVSVGLGGVAPDQPTVFSSLPANGNFVAFASNASNLVAGDTNGSSDVFVRDLQNATTERVSVSNNGSQGSSYSRDPAISGDGRFVAFSSNSSLVAQDTNGVIDVYVRDRIAGTTTWISRGAGGAQPNGNSTPVAMTRNGDWILFESAASNLVAGDTNAHIDGFLYSSATGLVQRMLVGIGGSQPNWDVSPTSMSSDARFVGFHSFATNIAPLDQNAFGDAFVYDSFTGKAELVSRSTSGAPGDQNSNDVVVTDDGRTAVFISKASTLVSGDTNNLFDVFVRERVGSVPEIYCTAQTNSLGCVPSIAASGIPSASSAAPFDILASNVLNERTGLLFYGFASSQIPFHGGWLCTAGPLSRTPVQNSGGTPAPPDDCSGQFTFDFNALVRSGTDPRLAGGAIVYAQYWSRDPLTPITTNLTDALAFQVEP